ncbi:MAG: hypothetical protein UV97_C0004G0042 [Candidatus Yanofskybacteria bacterium GW2011_GWF2_43_596]|nr:MAG: hypothetical protein UV97_C0004G0042 [Candidatus Yanofskybacteria bacterium GW2011_GWF2_43_596]
MAARWRLWRSVRCYSIFAARARIFSPSLTLKIPSLTASATVSARCFGSTVFTRASAEIARTKSGRPGPLDSVSAAFIVATATPASWPPSLPAFARSCLRRGRWSRAPLRPRWRRSFAMLARLRPGACDGAVRGHTDTE